MSWPVNPSEMKAKFEYLKLFKHGTTTIFEAVLNIFSGEHRD